MNDDEYKVIKLISDRIDDIKESIRIINDSHERLEIEFYGQKEEFIEFKTQIMTIVKIVKWLVPGSAILSGIVLLVKILEMVGWV